MKHESRKKKNIVNVERMEQIEEKKKKSLT